MSDADHFLGDYVSRVGSNHGCTPADFLPISLGAPDMKILPGYIDCTLLNWRIYTCYFLCTEFNDTKYCGSLKTTGHICFTEQWTWKWNGNVLIWQCHQKHSWSTYQLKALLKLIFFPFIWKLSKTPLKDRVSVKSLNVLHKKSMHLLYLVTV